MIEEIMRLTEALKLTSDLVDKLFAQLMMHISAEDLDESLLREIKTAGELTRDIT